MESEGQKSRYASGSAGGTRCRKSCAKYLGTWGRRRGARAETKGSKRLTRAAGQKASQRSVPCFEHHPSERAAAYFKCRRMGKDTPNQHP